MPPQVVIDPRSPVRPVYLSSDFPPQRRPRGRSALSAVASAASTLSEAAPLCQKTEVRVERVLYWQHGGALSVSRAVTSPCVA